MAEAQIAAWEWGRGGARKGQERESGGQSPSTLQLRLSSLDLL